MAFDIGDALQVVLELIVNWRMWLPTAIAAAIAALFYFYLPEYGGRGAAPVVIVAAGFVLGFYWQHRFEGRGKDL